MKVKQLIGRRFSYLAQSQMLVIILKRKTRRRFKNKVRFVEKIYLQQLIRNADRIAAHCIKLRRMQRYNGFLSSMFLSSFSVFGL